MPKRIKNSLSAKVFLWVFGALTICSLLIYGLVLTFLPRQYQVMSDRQLDANTERLAARLQTMRYEEAAEEIYNFCIQNHSAALLSDGSETLSFGTLADEQPQELSAATESFAMTVTFQDSETAYALVVSSASQTAGQLLSLLLRFLPVVLAVIVLLSCFSAWICSRGIVAPIAEISRISQRMTSFDRTWNCEVKRSDEIGVLAVSLNTMAAQLQGAMQELTKANQQLTDDVERFQALEEQRRNFFAAVSHELKTPLTILKGQIENMILGCGAYQNHEIYLPEALKTVEQIEHLVSEIMTVTKMERMDLQHTLQEVSLRTSIDDTVQAILPLAEEKQIRIDQQLCTERTLLVNANLWRKALSNMIGNAVRHSPCGEQVFIYLRSGEQGEVLVIENTGVFLPKEDISQLFTPFYRVDQSRSKATGGSGLGLYIVKTILDLHGLTYGIQNTERGVAFYLYLDL